MKGKLVGCDWELNTLTLQFDNLEEFEASARYLEVLEVEELETQNKILKELLNDLIDKADSYRKIAGNSSGTEVGIAITSARETLKKLGVE